MRSEAQAGTSNDDAPDLLAHTAGPIHVLTEKQVTIEERAYEDHTAELDRLGVRFLGAKGPDTYLNGARHGWPADHTAEDTFDLPPKLNAAVEGACYTTEGGVEHDMSEFKARNAFFNSIMSNETPEYKAEFGTDGSARLYIYTPRKLVGSFDSYADAQLAAEALNNYKGY